MNSLISSDSLLALKSGFTVFALLLKHKSIELYMHCVYISFPSMHYIQLNATYSISQFAFVEY